MTNTEELLSCYLTRPLSEIVPAEDCCQRPRLDSSEAWAEFHAAIEKFRQEAIAAVQSDNYTEAELACYELDRRIRELGMKYVGEEYTFEIDKTRNWGEAILWFLGRIKRGI